MLPRHQVTPPTTFLYCRDQVRQYCEEKLMPRVLLANREEPFSAHNLLAKAMITHTHTLATPTLRLRSKVKLGACACNLIKSKMASVRGYSDMSQYAPRPPEGVWSFVKIKVML